MCQRDCDAEVEMCGMRYKARLVGGGGTKVGEGCKVETEKEWRSMV